MSKSMVKRLLSQLADEPREKLIDIIAKLEQERTDALGKLGEVTKFRDECERQFQEKVADVGRLESRLQASEKLVSDLTQLVHLNVGRLDAVRKILEADLVTSGCATCHELGRLLSVSGVERRDAETVRARC